MHILRSNCRIVILFVIAITFFRPQIAAGQTESYLVTAADSTVSLYDLATSSFIKSINAGSNPFSVAVSPNQRLAFVGSEGYVSVLSDALDVRSNVFRGFMRRTSRHSPPTGNCC